MSEPSSSAHRPPSRRSPSSTARVGRAQRRSSGSSESGFAARCGPYTDVPVPLVSRGTASRPSRTAKTRRLGSSRWASPTRSSLSGSGAAHTCTAGWLPEVSAISPRRRPTASLPSSAARTSAPRARLSQNVSSHGSAVSSAHSGSSGSVRTVTRSPSAYSSRVYRSGLSRPSRVSRVMWKGSSGSTSTTVAVVTTARCNRSAYVDTEPRRSPAHTTAATSAATAPAAYAKGHGGGPISRTARSTQSGTMTVPADEPSSAARRRRADRIRRSSVRHSRV